MQVDPIVLNNLPQHEIREAPAAAEFKSAISSMAYEKAPSQSGLTTDMIKNLPPQAFNYHVDLIQKFRSDTETAFDSWRVTILNVLYKGKGDPQNPNYSRWMALKRFQQKSLLLS